MTDSSKKILDKIEKDKIDPKPKWQFRLEQVGLWFLAVFSVLIGSNAVAAIIFRMVNNDWDTLKFLQRSPIGHALTTLPYVWIVVLGLFVLLAYYNTRHTKKGYKYNTYGVVIGAVLASVIVGTVIYSVGFAPRVDRFMESVPGMEKLMHSREEIWMHPEKGFVAGEIQQILGGVGIFSIEDLEGQYWVVRPGEDYRVHPAVIIVEGEYVRIIGTPKESELFMADQIMPWQFGPEPKGMFDGKARQNFKGMK
ncbi:hypothetical protein KKA01_03995 [Patescibacteria group bacterium]|nr:hypothetical protein [Patescibacteria group bacterium]